MRPEISVTTLNTIKYIILYFLCKRFLNHTLFTLAEHIVQISNLIGKLTLYDLIQKWLKTYFLDKRC